MTSLISPPMHYFSPLSTNHAGGRNFIITYFSINIFRRNHHLSTEGSPNSLQMMCLAMPDQWWILLVFQKTDITTSHHWIICFTVAERSSNIIVPHIFSTTVWRLIVSWWSLYFWDGVCGPWYRRDLETVGESVIDIGAIAILTILLRYSGSVNKTLTSCLRTATTCRQGRKCWQPKDEEHRKLSPDLSTLCGYSVQAVGVSGMIDGDNDFSKQMWFLIMISIRNFINRL